jgi:hypothetical protein
VSYVILTDKDGVFHTETDDRLRPIERYDYFFCGQRRARFTLAEVVAETRVKIVDTDAPGRVNLVPSKHLPHFDTIEAARRELTTLTHYGRMDASLRKVP